MSAYPAGVVEFTEEIKALPHHQDPRLRNLFDPALPIHVGRAPGRLDVLGGIADYSGSLVLQWPLEAAALVAVQTCSGGWQAVSLGGDGEPDRWAEGPGLGSGDALDPAVIQHVRRQGWGAYVAGPWLVLVALGVLAADTAFRALVRSAVPEARGVASSAALEVATATALCRAHGAEIEPVRLALACQEAENEVVGAACGAMDQVVAAAGRAAHLAAILCRPAELAGYVGLPPGLAVWGIDSGVRHAVSGNDYTTVRAAAFMGREILGWGGHLAEMSPSAFSDRGGHLLPESMTGSEFLATRSGTADVATTVSPETAYPVRAATAFPIHENSRASRFRSICEGDGDTASPLLGELLLESNAGYTACGLGSEATDLVVDLVRQDGGDQLFGARASGGGSGGTVVVLGREEGGGRVRRIAAEYRRRTGLGGGVFEGSSDGSAVIGGSSSAREPPRQSWRSTAARRDCAARTRSTSNLGERSKW